MKNYSRQRQAVLRALQSTDRHPTAVQVYETVKKEIPNISLGTVYRNISQLLENGDIIRVSTEDESIHYDGNPKFHLHLCCRKCKTIYDLPLSEKVLTDPAEQSGFSVEKASCTVSGVCRFCQNGDENDSFGKS